MKKYQIEQRLRQAVFRLPNKRRKAFDLARFVKDRLITPCGRFELRWSPREGKRFGWVDFVEVT